MREEEVSFEPDRVNTKYIIMIELSLEPYSSNAYICFERHIIKLSTCAVQKAPIFESWITTLWLYLKLFLSLSFLCVCVFVCRSFGGSCAALANHVACNWNETSVIFFIHIKINLSRKNLETQHSTMCKRKHPYLQIVAVEYLLCNNPL